MKNEKKTFLTFCRGNLKKFENIPLRSRLIRDFKNIFIFILAAFPARLRRVLALPFRQKLIKTCRFSAFSCLNWSDKTRRNFIFEIKNKFGILLNSLNFPGKQFSFLFFFNFHSLLRQRHNVVFCIYYKLWKI